MLDVSRILRCILRTMKGCAISLLGTCCAQRTGRKRRYPTVLATLAVTAAICVLIVWLASTKEAGQLAQTPPMGWNSWNNFKCDGLNEDLVKVTADTLVKTGLAKAGYIYVNLDDCWQKDRDDLGNIRPDRSHFKNGMKPLADYIHSRGLKFGLYTAIGTLTCQRRPGSRGYETQDAQAYASWNVDFIKNDDCTMYPTLDIEEGYHRMWNAIIATKRPMIQSVKGVQNIETAHLVSHMRRIGRDINPTWDSMLSLIDKVAEEKLWKFARPGFWNDLDMLEIGNEGLSDSENIAHMALWCAFKAPLLLGNDIRNMSNFTLQLLTHNELLAVLQDPLGKSVQRVHVSNAPDGNAANQVVTKQCNPKDPRQLWHYNEQTGSLTNLRTSKCLTLGWHNYTYLEECDSGVTSQQWRIDFHTRQIHKSDTMCLNTQPVANAGSSVRECYKRRGPKDFSKHNGHTTTYNDAFRMEVLDSNTFMFTNARKLCPSAGGPLEINIFAGPLAKDKYVAVLLNRDNKPHSVNLRWSYLPMITNVHHLYRVRDIYRRRDLGNFKESFSSNVDAHSVIVVTLTPL